MVPLWLVGYVQYCNGAINGVGTGTPSRIGEWYHFPEAQRGVAPRSDNGTIKLGRGQAMHGCQASKKNGALGEIELNPIMGPLFFGGEALP